LSTLPASFAGSSDRSRADRSVRAELYRPAPADGQAETVVAVATWRGGATSIDVLDPSDASAAGIGAIVRPTPVVVDDPGLRSAGTRGPVLLHPGDLEWFVQALRSRGEALGLSVRIVPEDGPGGWDPASTYRTFDQQVEKLERDREGG
jgi:hypothetical protein